MEKHQKRALDDNLHHLQQNLVLNDMFYAGLIQHQIFNANMVDAVKCKNSASSRMMELVHLLKKRSPSCFDDFLQVMKDTSQHHLASDLLKSLHSISRRGAFSHERERVKDFLVHHFHSSRKLTSNDIQLFQDELVMYEDFICEQEKNQRLLNDIHLKESEIQHKEQDIEDLLVKLDFYMKDVEENQEKVTCLQSEIDQLRGNTPRPISRPSDGCQTGRFSSDDDLRQMIKQKDLTIKKTGQQYDHLKSSMEKCQADNESLQELNRQYLLIISQLDDMQRNEMPRSPVSTSSAEYAEIEDKLEAAETQVAQLEKDLEGANEWLIETQEELEEVLAREVKLKEKLGLHAGANERQVSQRIRQLASGGSGQKKETDKLKKELAQNKVQCSYLTDKVTSLTRERDRLIFDLRQQDLLIKKLTRTKKAKEMLDSVSAKFGGKQKTCQPLPTITVAPLNIDRNRSNLKPEVTQHYCVLCRKVFNHEDAVCRFHYRALSGKKWQCCKDKCAYSAGCLSVSHFYVEISSDARAFLTNGKQYLPLL